MGASGVSGKDGRKELAQKKAIKLSVPTFERVMKKSKDDWA